MKLLYYKKNCLEIFSTSFSNILNSRTSSFSLCWTLRSNGLKYNLKQPNVAIYQEIKQIINTATIKIKQIHFVRSASGIELVRESLVDVIVLIDGLPFPISPPDAMKLTGKEAANSYHKFSLPFIVNSTLYIISVPLK